MAEMIYSNITMKNDCSNIDSIAVDFDQEMEIDDINIPPPRDSPKHILNALNDDCIKEIVRRIETDENLLSVAAVCVQFQENVKTCLPQSLRKLKISENKSSPSTLSLEHLPSFLRVFGYLVESIDLNVPRSFYLDINMIADFCGETLKELKIVADFNIDSMTRSSFQALEKFELHNAEFHALNVMSSLKSLKFYDVHIESDWLGREFPKLEEIELVFVSHLNLKVRLEFLACNPQLKSLKLCNRYIDQSVLEYIGQRTTLIEHLIFYTRFNFADLDFMALSGLKHLKSLHFYNYGISIKSLIQSFAENVVPLEKLWIEANPDYVEHLIKLESIDELVVTEISDEMLAQIIQNLPVLKLLVVVSTEVTIDGIKQALRLGRRSQNICFDARHLDLDFDEYSSLLALARNRGLMLEIKT